MKTRATGRWFTDIHRIFIGWFFGYHKFDNHGIYLYFYKTNRR